MVVTHNDILNAIVNAENIAFMYSQARVNTLSNGILPTAEQNAAIIELEAWINILEIAESQWEEGCITSDDTWQVIQNINELSQRVPCNVSRTFSRNSSSGGGGSTTTGYVERVFAYLVAANAPEVLNTIVDNSNPSRPIIKLFIDGTTITGTGTEEDPLVAAGGSGSGTVNNGTQYRIAYYAATGTAVSQANAITANRALISDANGVPTHSSVTATTLGYLDATSSVQTQLNGKQASLGFTPENVANKATNFTTLNSTLYPTTQAVADYVAQAVAGLLDLRGTYDASTNLFPSTGGSGTAGAILKGDLWVISVAGTLGGESVIAGQSIFANVDTPAQTAANWEILPVGIITTPTLQQVLDAGNISTTDLSITDGTDAVSIKKNLIKIDNSLSGEATISSPTLTTAIDFILPNKALGPQTFAMLSDITGGGGDVVGPASAVNNNIVLFDGTTGKLIKDSGAALSSKLDVAAGANYRLTASDGSGNRGNAAAITAARALKSDANGIPTHFDTATEPSLTELSYVKGVTSSIQTQLDAKANTFTIQCAFTTITTVNDGTSYHFGILQGVTASGTANRRDFKFTQAGTLKIVSLSLDQATNGSNETVNIYLRNVTTATDYSIGTFTSDFGANTTLKTRFTGLSIAVNTSDDWVVKILTPTWGTNPSSWTGAVILDIQV